MSGIDLSRALTFYGKVALPLFGLNIDAHPVRVYQALYRCAALSPSAKQVLTDTYFNGNSSTEPYRYILQCAAEMDNLVRVGIIANALSIPDSVKVQLVYKSIGTKDAFGSLTQTFPDVMADAKATLLYEGRCNLALYWLENNLASDTMMTDLFKGNTFSIGGCLTTIRQLTGPRASLRDASSLPSTFIKDKILLPLKNLELRHAEDIKKYEEIMVELADVKYNVTAVMNAMVRGMPLNLMAARGAFNNTLALSYAILMQGDKKAIQAYIAAGLNLNPLLSDGKHIFSYCFEVRMGIPLASAGPSAVDASPFLWFVEQGADLEQRSLSGNTILLDMALDQNFVRQYWPIMERLALYGADLLRTTRDGLTALVAASRPMSELQFRTLLDAGRPDLRRTVDINPRPLIFNLVESGIALRPLAYLLSKSLAWKELDGLGATISVFAQRRADPAVAAYLALLERVRAPAS